MTESISDSGVAIKIASSLRWGTLNYQLTTATTPTNKALERHVCFIGIKASPLCGWYCALDMRKWHYSREVLSMALPWRPVVAIKQYYHISLSPLGSDIIVNGSNVSAMLPMQNFLVDRTEGCFDYGQR